MKPNKKKMTPTEAVKEITDSCGWLKDIEETVDKKKKPKPTADEMLWEMQYRKTIEFEHSVEYKNMVTGTKIMIRKDDDGYSFKKQHDLADVWITSKEEKAIRKKLKELGWR